MKTGIIKTKSFVNCGFRFDPDIHLSEGVQVRQSINNLPYEISNIGENAEKVFYGNIFSRVFVEKPEFGVFGHWVLCGIQSCHLIHKQPRNIIGAVFV